MSMSVCVCVEVEPAGVVDTDMESEMRAMARRRRLVFVALVAALLTCTAYVVYVNSGIPSEEGTTFFQGQIEPAALLEKPLTVCLRLPEILFLFSRFYSV